MDLGRLDTAYLLQLTGRNIELEAVISTMSAVATIKQGYWTNRPKHPMEDELKGVRGELHFAEAMDLVAELQRGLKLKDAWIRSMKIIVKDQQEATTKEWLTEVPFAVDDILGTWINGAKEEEVYWLLKHKVPCFIIHEVSVTELYDHRDEPRNHDFIALTDAKYLAPECNGFDHVALRLKMSVTHDSRQEGIPSTTPILSAEDRVGSSLAAQGWIKTKHRLLEEAQEVVMIPLEPHLTTDRSTSEPRVLSSIPAGKVLEPEVKLIAADKVEWLVPPAMMEVTAGKWTLWEEYDLDYDNSCFCLVTTRPEDCSRMYYDQKERREIFFMEGLTIPPGAVSDHATFGFPAPMARYVEIVEGKVVKEH